MSTEKLPFKLPLQPSTSSYGRFALADADGRTVVVDCLLKTDQEALLHMLNTWPKLVDALAEAITLNSVAEHAQDEEWQSKLDECNKVYDAAQLPKGKPIQ